MKYIVLLADGMADRPIKKLGGKTPLMVADIPNINRLCSKGRCGHLTTVPRDMPPGSEVANLAVMGYNVREVYQGRAPLEAANMGIELHPEDLAVRCNLVCIQEGHIKNHSAGHISTEEASEIIDYLNEQLASETLRFYPGVSYRHLLVLKEGVNDIRCTPPHDIPGKPFHDFLVEPTSLPGKPTADLLNHLIFRSQQILEEHPVNQKRIAAGKDPATSVWFWSSGKKPRMKTLHELFGKTGAVISAVDLVNGIGVYAGMDVIHVEGATGLYDTNYRGKAQATINALNDHDFVYLHIEAPDEAGHEGNVDLKIRVLEDIDRLVVQHLVKETEQMEKKVTIAILPDHPTPCEIRTHVHDPVPFLIYRPGETPDAVQTYDEFSVRKGSYGMLKEDEFIRELFSR